MSNCNWEVTFYTKPTIYNQFSDILNYLNIKTYYKENKINYLEIQHNKRKEHELLLFDCDTLINTKLNEYLPKNKYIVLYDKTDIEEIEIKNNDFYELLKNSLTIWYYKGNKSNNIFKSIFNHTPSYEIINTPVYKRVNKKIDILVQCKMSSRNRTIISCLGQFFNIIWCPTNNVHEYLKDTKIILYLLDESEKESTNNKSNIEQLFQIANILKGNNLCVIKEDNNSNNFSDMYNYLRQNHYFQICNLIDLNNKTSSSELIQFLNGIIQKFSNTLGILNLEVFEKTFKLTPKYNANDIYIFGLNYNYTDSVILLEDYDKKQNNASFFQYYMNYIKYIKDYKNNTKDKLKIKSNNVNSCVFVSFERYPHIQHIIHNMVEMFHNQGYYWNHVIICGSHNVSYIKNICNNIESYFENINFQIQQLDIFSNELQFVNKAMYMKELWNSIPGEIIFLYNSKFNKWNLILDDIMNIDLVIDSNTVEPSFSLRRKSHMINILENYTINAVNYDYTLFMDFIEKHKMSLPPECIYFSNIYLQKQYGSIRFKN